MDAGRIRVTVSEKGKSEENQDADNCGGIGVGEGMKGVEMDEVNGRVWSGVEWQWRKNVFFFSGKGRLASFLPVSWAGRCI